MSGVLTHILLEKVRLLLLPRRSMRERLYFRYIRPQLILLAAPRSEPETVARRPARSSSAVSAVRNSARAAVDVRDILLVKCDHIGDFLLAVQAFKIIRAGFSNARITLLCGRWNEPLAKRLGLFDRIIVVDVYPEISSGPELPPPELNHLALPKFDLAIDLKVEENNRFLLNYISAAMTAGFQSRDVLESPQLDFAIPTPPLCTDGLPHYASHNQVLLSMLASSVVNFFNVQTDTLNGLAPLVGDGISDVLLIRRGKGPLVGISTGSGAPTKNWPIQYHETVIRTLIQRYDATVVLFGSKGQREDAAYLVKAVRHGSLHDLTGTTRITDMPSLILQLDIYIGHDTGGTHLASALGQATICLHSGVSPGQSFAPIGENTVVLKCWGLPCAPCGLTHLSGCAYNHACMRAISPHAVLAEVERLEAQRARRAGPRGSFPVFLSARRG
jgi:ADP-heptose:LPS heptosyltransferase